jgi:uncharacterized peroxidase-related enzyme
MILWLFPLLARTRPTDFTRILLYRPEFFGKPFGRYAQSVLRGPSGAWSVGERELFGAYISAHNDCAFCTDLHCLIASRSLGLDDVDTIVAGKSTKGLRTQASLMLDFLQHMETDLGSLTPGHLGALRAAGLSDAAILEAVHAGTVLGIANRIVNALGAARATPTQNSRVAKMLLKKGYDL